MWPTPQLLFQVSLEQICRHKCQSDKPLILSKPSRLPNNLCHVWKQNMTLAALFWVIPYPERGRSLSTVGHKFEAAHLQLLAALCLQRFQVSILAVDSACEYPLLAPLENRQLTVVYLESIIAWGRSWTTEGICNQCYFCLQVWCLSQCMACMARQPQNGICLQKWRSQGCLTRSGTPSALWWMASSFSSLVLPASISLSGQASIHEPKIVVFFNFYGSKHIAQRLFNAKPQCGRNRSYHAMILTNAALPWISQWFSFLSFHINACIKSLKGSIPFMLSAIFDLIRIGRIPQIFSCKTP